MGTWRVCQTHGIEELLLVLGCTGLEWEREVSFTSPTQNPSTTFIYMREELKLPDENSGLRILGEDADRNWQEIEETMVQEAEDLKLQRAKDREQAFACK